MEILTFLKETTDWVPGFTARGYEYERELEIRPRVKCKDGFEVSVQASRYHYCYPRENLEDGYYSKVELGFPSETMGKEINKHAESPGRLLTTVYAYVDIELVEEELQKHGGIDWGKSHERDEKLKNESSGPKRPFELEEIYVPWKTKVKSTPKYTHRFNVQVENEFYLGEVFQEVQEILNVNKIIHGEVNMNLGLKPYVGVDMLSMEGLTLLSEEVRKLTSKYKLELSGTDEYGNKCIQQIKSE